MVKFVLTYTKGALIKRLAKDLCINAYVIFLCFFFPSDSFVKAYVMSRNASTS